MSRLAPILQGFFTDRLSRQRQASPHTVAAYRDSIRLLVAYAANATGKQPVDLDVTDLDAALIVAFGVGLLPDAVRLLGGDQPARSARLVLTGPAGGDWTLPLGSGDPASTPAATVTMDAVEFCYLLGNRRDPGSVPHTVEGDPELAATLLRAAATLGCD